MRFGLSTFFFFTKPLETVVEEIRAAGFGAVEVVCEMPHFADAERRLTGRLGRLKDADIAFSVHAPFLEVNLGSYHRDVRKYSMRRTKAAADLAAHLGADPLVVHPGYSFLRHKVREIEKKTMGNFLDDLREIVEYAGERGVRVALENVQMPFFLFFDLPEFPDIARQVPGLGLTLDIGHAYLGKRQKAVEDPEEAILGDLSRMGVGCLFHVHLHNNRGGRDDHSFLEGSIDMKRLLAGLGRAGYSGKVIVETTDVEGRGLGPVLEKLREIAPAETAGPLPR